MVVLIGARPDQDISIEILIFPPHLPVHRSLPPSPLLARQRHRGEHSRKTVNKRVHNPTAWPLTKLVLTKLALAKLVRRGKLVLAKLCLTELVLGHELSLLLELVLRPKVGLELILAARELLDELLPTV